MWSGHQVDYQEQQEDEFAHGSRAKDAGVRASDMLKAVDGPDILQMQVDEATCEQTAGDLLQGSMCELPLLRRVARKWS